MYKTIATAAPRSRYWRGITGETQKARADRLGVTVGELPLIDELTVLLSEKWWSCGGKRAVQFYRHSQQLETTPHALVLAHRLQKSDSKTYLTIESALTSPLMQATRQDLNKLFENFIAPELVTQAVWATLGLQTLPEATTFMFKIEPQLEAKKNLFLDNLKALIPTLPRTYEDEYPIVNRIIGAVKDLKHRMLTVNASHQVGTYKAILMAQKGLSYKGEGMLSLFEYRAEFQNELMKLKIPQELFQKIEAQLGKIVLYRDKSDSEYREDVYIYTYHPLSFSMIGSAYFVVLVQEASSGLSEVYQRAAIQWLNTSHSRYCVDDPKAALESLLVQFREFQNQGIRDNELIEVAERFAYSKAQYSTKEYLQKYRTEEYKEICKKRDKYNQGRSMYTADFKSGNKDFDFGNYELAFNVLADIVPQIFFKRSPYFEPFYRVCGIATVQQAYRSFEEYSSLALTSAQYTKAGRLDNRFSQSKTKAQIVAILRLYEDNPALEAFFEDGVKRGKTWSPQEAHASFVIYKGKGLDINSCIWASTVYEHYKGTKTESAVGDLIKTYATNASLKAVYEDGLKRGKAWGPQEAQEAFDCFPTEGLKPEQCVKASVLYDGYQAQKTQAEVVAIVKLFAKHPHLEPFYLDGKTRGKIWSPQEALVQLQAFRAAGLTDRFSFADRLHAYDVQIGGSKTQAQVVSEMHAFDRLIYGAAEQRVPVYREQGLLPHQDKLAEFFVKGLPNSLAKEISLQAPREIVIKIATRVKALCEAEKEVRWLAWLELGIPERFLVDIEAHFQKKIATSTSVISNFIPGKAAPSSSYPYSAPIREETLSARTEEPHFQGIFSEETRTPLELTNSSYRNALKALYKRSIEIYRYTAFRETTFYSHELLLGAFSRYSALTNDFKQTKLQSYLPNQKLCTEATMTRLWDEYTQQRDSKITSLCRTLNATEQASLTQHLNRLPLNSLDTSAQQWATPIRADILRSLGAQDYEVGALSGYQVFPSIDTDSMRKVLNKYRVDQVREKELAREREVKEQALAREQEVQRAREEAEKQLMAIQQREQTLVTMVKTATQSYESRANYSIRELQSLAEREVPGYRIIRTFWRAATSDGPELMEEVAEVGQFGTNFGSYGDAEERRKRLVEELFQKKIKDHEESIQKSHRYLKECERELALFRENNL